MGSVIERRLSSIDLLFLVLELVVDLVEILHSYSVSNHLEWIDLALLNTLEKVLPVEMNWRLAVANESNSALHYRADVELSPSVSIVTGVGAKRYLRDL